MVDIKYNLLTMLVCSTLMVSTVISTQNGAKKLNRMNYVAYAISEIIDNLSDRDLINFDVLVYGYDKQLQFLAHQIIKNIADGIHSVNIEKKSHNDIFLSKCDQTTKIILASQALKVVYSDGPINVEEKLQFHAYHDSVLLFYYLNESNLTVYTNTFEKLTMDIMPRVLFIGHTTDRNSNNLKLYGYVKYLTCAYAFDLSLRNTFNASTMKWTNQTFKHEYKNFNGCPLIVYSTQATNCTIQIKRSNKGKILGLSSFYGDLLHLYAEKLNAIIHVQAVYSEAVFPRVDIAFIHTTAFGTIPKYMFTPTVAIDGHQIAFLVTRGDEFTPFEKLILPFDSVTWYLSIFTILAGYFVILILNQMPIYLQKFVFGTYNRNPSMSLAQIFFGIGLIQTPGRNFARFIFMMFTIFCLIIRTTYQSKMYEFLQYDVRQPTMKTITEIQQKNVSIFRWPVLLSEELEKELNVPLFITEDYFNTRFYVDKAGEYAFVIDRAQLKCIKNLDPLLHRDIGKRMRLTDDDLVSGLNSWYILMNSVVHNSLNKFLLECHQHGIISHFEKKIRGKIQNMYVPEEETKVLTMYMLSAGFYVWLVSIGIACVVFVLEHIHKRVTRQ